MQDACPGQVRAMSTVPAPGRAVYRESGDSWIHQSLHQVMKCLLYKTGFGTRSACFQVSPWDIIYRSTFKEKMKIISPRREERPIPCVPETLLVNRLVFAFLLRELVDDVLLQRSVSAAKWTPGKKGCSKVNRGPWLMWQHQIACEEDTQLK